MAARKTASKAPAKKTAAKKTAAKTTTASKKSPLKKSSRKYSPAASAQVAEDLHEMHRGQLHIGTSDKLLTNPKQALAIGLAPARRAGKKVPPNPNDPGK